MKRLIILILLLLCRNPSSITSAQILTTTELLRFANGAPVCNVRDWQDKRRPQLLDTLRNCIYGYIPNDSSLRTVYQVISTDRQALNKKATLKQVRITFFKGSRTHSVTLLLIVPNQVKRPPVFLGYNFHGNYTLTNAPQVPLTDKWINQKLADGTTTHCAREELRGSAAKEWQIDNMISRGYALATLHYGDIYEDYEKGYDNSIAPLLYQGDPVRKTCGRLGLWAWGLSRMMDYLQQEKLVDPERVIVTGVSRLAKAALWAGAQDQRFAMVVAHCAGGVKKTADRKELLLALVAPRPIYSTTSEEDIYAVPALEFAYLKRADSIYRFLGRPGINRKELPGPYDPVQDGFIGFHITPGKHGVKPYDWQQAMNFADRIFGRPYSPLPELLDPGTTSQTWRHRRDELLKLFEENEYGRIPANIPIKMTSRIVSTDRKAMGGMATRKEVLLVFKKKMQRCSLQLLIYIPNGLKHAASLFLGANFKGNHSICNDPGIMIPDISRYRNPRHGIDTLHRGSDSLSWNLRETLRRGYAIATFYNGDLCEDWPQGPKYDIGAMLYPEGRDSLSCGFIGITAWGLSRIMDYLRHEPRIDSHRIALIGCSRNGKIALWAGANDERFAMVISSSSGSGGASLFRGNTAESIGDICTRFPQWMAPSFARYAHCTGEFPVDQHQLLALIAPRPLYVADSDRDRYAVPKDEFASLQAAAPIYELLGLHPADMNLPPAPGQSITGPLGFHTKPGEHSITAIDWRYYYDFADYHFGRPQFKKIQP